MAKKNDWVTRDILLEVYRRTGSIHRTAEELHVGSTTITRWFKKWEIPYTPRKELPMIGLRGVPKSEEHKRKLREYANRPDVKGKRRQALLKRLPTMNGSCRNSPLELLLENQLKEAKISYEAQKVMLQRYVVDFLLIDYPVVIEADGSVHRLGRTKAHDRERDRLLLEAGYYTLRFTGTEINKSPAGCINQVIEFIENKIASGEFTRASKHDFIGRRLEVKGRNHPSFGKRRSKESIEKQRQALIGKKQSPETIQKRVAKIKGMKHPEAGAKISKAKMGHTVSEETRRKISEKLKGHKLTPEQQQRQCEGLKRAYAEGRRKCEVSAETRAKISATLKANYQNGNNGLCKINAKRIEDSKRKFSS